MRIFCGLCCALVIALLCLTFADFNTSPPQQRAALDLQTVSFVDGVKIKPPAPPQFILVSNGGEDKQASAAPDSGAGDKRSQTFAKPGNSAKQNAAEQKPSPAKSLFPPIKDKRKPRRQKQQPSPSDRVSDSKATPAETSQPDIYLGPPPQGQSDEAAPGYTSPSSPRPTLSGESARTKQQPTLAQPAPELPPIEALAPSPANTSSLPQTQPGEQIEVGPEITGPHADSLPEIQTPDVQVEVTPATLQPRPTRWNPAVTTPDNAPQIEATVAQPKDVYDEPSNDAQWRSPGEFSSPTIVVPSGQSEENAAAEVTQDAPYIHQMDQGATGSGLAPTYEEFAGQCSQHSAGGCGFCWSAAVDVLALTRSNGPGTRLAQNAAGATLSGDQLNPDLEIGYRGSLMMDAGDYAWEFVYLHQNWATSAGLAGNVNSVAGVADFTNAASVLAESETTLNSIELNHIRCHHTFSPWQVGFRYVNLRDRLQLNSGVAGSRSDYRIRTTNDLFGVQVGRGINYQYGAFGFHAVAKAGLYLNSANQRVRLRDNNNTVLRRSYSDSDASAAFLGELNLMATYNVAPHFAIRGGYQILWLEGIAEAPSQFLPSNPGTQAATAIDTHDGLFAHGFYGGIEFNY